MEAKFQTLETFLPALLSRFEQSEAKLEARLEQTAQEARQDRKELESRMEQSTREIRESRRSSIYFVIATFVAILTLAAAIYFGLQNIK